MSGGFLAGTGGFSPGAGVGGIGITMGLGYGTGVGVSIGIDAGIESFIATPTELIKSPKFLTHQARKLKLLQRRLKKKTKGSNNWLKLQKRIARIHEKVANTRRDWHFKLAHYICDQADK